MISIVFVHSGLLEVLWDLDVACPTESKRLHSRSGFFLELTATVISSRDFWERYTYSLVYTFIALTTNKFLLCMWQKYCMSYLWPR